MKIEQEKSNIANGQSQDNLQIEKNAIEMQKSKTEQNSAEQKTNQAQKKEFWRAVKFLLFSISAGVIQILSFTILNEFVIKDTGNEYGWSYFISLILSVLWNFTFNRKFTFKSAKNVPIAMLLVLAYYVVFAPLSIWWGVSLKNAGWNGYLVLALTMVVNFVTEFLWTRFVVYKDNVDTMQNGNKS